MSLEKLDHIAVEVGNLDYYIDQLVGTGAMKLLRTGTVRNTGARMAMVGDQAGMKLELIESPEAAGAPPRFLHLAFSSDDAEQSSKVLQDNGWTWERGPFDIAPAQAKSVILSDGKGLEVQVLTYQSTSPDLATWSKDAG